jgi:2,3-dihydroxybenzoate decarboxylase
MRDKIALEDHISSDAMNALWDSAGEAARETNDYIHRTFVESHPARFAFFATAALQDPEAASIELRRCVSELGAKGALVNGYTNIGHSTTARNLDEPENEPFWATVAELEVPVYVHPVSRCPRSFASTRGTHRSSARRGPSVTRHRRTRSG